MSRLSDPHNWAEPFAAAQPAPHVVLIATSASTQAPEKPLDWRGLEESIDRWQIDGGHWHAATHTERD